MAPTLCSRCGDAFDEGCDPREELAELDALLERLTLKRYDLKRKINQFHSPILRQLSPDITSTIFEFCLPNFADHRGDHLPLSMKKNHSLPLSRGAICSYWRDIAWSTPSLWSSLMFWDTHGFNSRTITGVVKEWLARSGRLPLSIRISSAYYNETVSTLVDIINQYSTRWFDLDLDIPDRCYERFHVTDNHAPILKSIRFHCTPDDIVGGTLNFELTCPRLERASLSYFSGETNIQWDNLSHLTLYSMSIIDSFHILRKTPRLVFFEISGCCRHTSNEQPLTTPVLTSLRSLHLLIDSSDAEYFLGNLIAPHLEEFRLPTRYIPRIEVVTSFLRKSACSLRSMILCNFLSYFDGFMNLLQSMPSLSTLSILTFEKCRPQIILQLVAKILYSQSTSLQQGFLPNLKILEFTGELYLCPGDYEDPYSLPPAHNVVHGPFRLLKLDLYQTTRIPEKMISYISNLEERGVKVNVSSGSEDILQSSKVERL